MKFPNLYRLFWKGNFNNQLTNSAFAIRGFESDLQWSGKASVDSKAWWEENKTNSYVLESPEMLRTLPRSKEAFNKTQKPFINLIPERHVAANQIHGYRREPGHNCNCKIHFCTWTSDKGNQQTVWTPIRPVPAIHSPSLFLYSAESWTLSTNE